MAYYKLEKIDKELALDNHEGTVTLLLDGEYYIPTKEIKSDNPKEEGLFIKIIEITKK